MKTLNFGLSLLILNFGFLTIMAHLAFASELANQFTIGVWVKPQSSAASKAIVVKNNEIRLVTNASSQPLCQIYSAGAWQTAATSSTTLPLNSWSHVACSYDKSTLRVYVNGVQTGSQAFSVVVNDAATNFRVGSDEGATYGDLNGSVDDLRIYNYARTPKQIIEDMNAGHPGVGSPVGSALAYYKFDEGYGATVNNFGNGGSSLNGTISGANWTNDGKFGKALHFDGINDYVGISGIDIANKSFSLSAWARRNVTDSTLLIFGQGIGGQNQSLHVGYEIGNKFTCAFYANDLDTSSQIDTSTEWTHWVCTYDTDSRSRKIYRNGKLVASDIASANYQGTGTLYIGKPPWDTSFFNGIIDEVKIYNYALTEDEIKAEYNRSAAMVLGSLSDTSGLSGGSVASNSASAEYCVPGDTAYCAPPVAEWKFDEKQGTTAYDTSGNGNNGTLIDGPTWVRGKIGGALSFDGSDDYVRTPTFNNLPTSYMTIEAWIKTNTNSSNVYIMQQNRNSTNYFNEWIFRITDGKLNFWDYGTSNYGFSTSNTSNSTINNNQWRHIVFVKNGVQGAYYIDGKLDATTTASSDIQYGSNDFVIGKDYRDNNAFFSGLIDNIRIYNYVRTPSQIAWDFNRGQPVAWWKFDECQGTTAYDSMRIGTTIPDGTITIGASGSQTSAGTCTSGNSTDAWYNGRNGKYNSSLNFDGTDDYVSTSNIALIAAASQTYSNVSWGAWVKASSNQTSKTIIHKSSEFRLYTDSNGYPTCQVGDTGNTAAATSALPNDTWSHLLCTYDGSNIKIYLNGTQIASNFRTGTITSSSSTNVNIAQKSDSSERYAGQIDDVRIYNYALTPVQVKNLFNEGATIRFGPSEGSP